MKIAIDSRALMNSPAGVGNFLINAINEFVKLDSDCKFYLLANRDLHREVHNRLIKSDNIIIIKNRLKIFGDIGIIWFIFKLYLIIKKLNPDILWGPANVLPVFIPSHIKTLLTVHDLVPKEYPESMMLVERISAKLFFDRSIKKADILWAVSNFTKNEIAEKYINRKSKNILVAQCFDHKLFHKKKITDQRKRELLDKFSIHEKFILYVGTIEPRKNLKFLISLMPNLVEYDFNLLVVGADGWGNSEIKELLNKPGFPRNSIRFSGFLETKDLVDIYNISSLLVFPSIYEGFGLPALEAMSCGCPVIAADKSGLTEVVLNGGLLIKGWQKSDWINGILDVYNHREDYIQKGLKKSYQYSSCITVKQVLTRIQEEVLIP